MANVTIEKMHDMLLDNEKMGNFLEKLLPDHEIVKVGNIYRIQPCLNCGHRDCLSVDTKQPTFNCFSCGFHGNLWELTVQAEGSKGKAKAFIEDFIGVELNPLGYHVDEKQQRLFDIRRIFAEACHDALMKDEMYSNYQIKKRKHNLESVEKFFIGKAVNANEIKNQLINMGYTKDEIDEAKVYIPEGLVVYPYLNQYGDIVRFNTKNPFNIKNKGGNIIKGYSTGPKAFYRSNNARNGEVVLVEGENDLISITEAGYDSVLATGGQITDKQIKELKNLNKIYACFDNDKAGENMTQKLNKALPEVKIYKIVFNEKFKDIDEFLKNCEEDIDIDQLIKNAVELENNKYSIDINGDELLLKNRNYRLEIKVLKQKEGRYKVDFKYYLQENLEDIKKNIYLDKLGKNYIHFIEPIYEDIEVYYNNGLEEKSIEELLSIRKHSRKNEQIVKIIAKKAMDAGYTEKEIDEHFSCYGTHVRDRILQGINQLKNAAADPNKIYESIILAQSFDIDKKVGYMYFNLIKVEKDGLIKEIPALLTSDKRIIRLDLIKRKDPQELLLVDKSFRLPYEIETKVMSSESVSLSNEYAQKFINDEISTEEVKIKNLIDKLIDNYQRVLYVDDSRVYVLLAVYTLVTYYYMLFGEMGYLYLNAEKGSGKSLTCKLLETYCFCPKYTVGASDAALFRSISFEGGTFILDELENLGSRGRANDSTMGQILKAGYSKDGGKTMRVNMETGSIDSFTLYSPKIISNIFGIEDVISDRCIPINIKKYPSSLTQTKENIKVFLQKNKEANNELNALCCISALVNFVEVFNSYSSYKFEGVSSRTSQILRPLLVIAKFCGEEYEKSIIEYYEEYIMKDKEWTEIMTPEGMIREIGSIIADEIYNKDYKLLKEEYGIKNDYYSGDGAYNFQVNSFVFKVLLDMLDGNKIYSVKETHKLLKRVFPTECESWTRTTISFKDNEELIRSNNNKSSASVYVINFQFNRFLEANEDFQESIMGGRSMVRRNQNKKRNAPFRGVGADKVNELF